MRQICLALMLGFAASAHAYFQVNPLISVNAGVVSAQVYNPYYEPIACDGLAFGQTYSGAVVQARFVDVIPPGQNRFAYVYTNAFYNPFVRGWGQIYCRFLRY